MPTFRRVHRQPQPNRSSTALPSLARILSEDSEDDEEEALVPFDEYQVAERPSQANTTDVRCCKSNTCAACKRGASPFFVPASIIAPSCIRFMPSRWWKETETGVEALLERLPDSLKLPVVPRDEIDAPFDEK